MKREQLFVILLALVTFFVFNTALPTDIMESRNIVTAREMVSDGHWLVPTMNGELRLEKPPLPTWVAGVVESVCPRSLGAQRAAAGVMGLLWTWFLYLSALQLSQRRKYALLAVMVFLTCYHIVVMGRTATWDIYCHAFMMGGVYLLMRGLIDDARHQWRWLPAAGVMMGLSFLSKGPVSFYALLLPLIIASLAIPTPSLKGKWPGLLTMVLVCVVISGWWYVYLFVCHPEAVDAVIRKESGAWSHHNVRPWWYYWRFFTETGVWAVIMLAALAINYWKHTLRDGRTYLFSITWTLAALVLLSLMPEKKIRYLLPMMAPCALTIACLLEHLDGAGDRVSRVLLRADGALTTLICLAIPVAALSLRWVSVPLGIVLAVLFAAVAVYIATSAWRQQARHMVWGVCVMFMLLECFLLRPVGELFGNPQRHSISLTADMPALKGIPFYHDKQEPVRIEVVYEAGRKILPINMKDSATVMRHLPFALVSHGYAAWALPPSVLNQVDTVSMGVYDDNKHPKNNRHYAPEFINHVTLVKSRAAVHSDKVGMAKTVKK